MKYCLRTGWHFSRIIEKQSSPSTSSRFRQSSFNLLYCFFVIEHARRRILHFNVTRHSLADWVVQQLRSAFPEAGSNRYVILDRDAKIDDSVTMFLPATGLTPKRSSVRAPWQNGTAERWIGSCRRELLNHIARDEHHLVRQLRDYVSY
jgi:hypothetical protein